MPTRRLAGLSGEFRSATLPALALCMLLVVVACDGLHNGRDVITDADLSGELADLIAMSEGEVLDMSGFGTFDWTRICVFPPYTAQAAAEGVMGIDWPYEWSSVEYLDDRSFLVFLQGDVVVAAFDHARSEGDFSQLGRRCIDRHEARFDVDRAGAARGETPRLSRLRDDLAAGKRRP